MFTHLEITFTETEHAAGWLNKLPISNNIQGYGNINNKFSY